MKLKGFSLYSTDFFQFNKGDYMLLNDPVNNIEGDKSIGKPNYATHCHISIALRHRNRKCNIFLIVKNPYIFFKGLKIYFTEIVTFMIMTRVLVNFLSRNYC